MHLQSILSTFFSRERLSCSERWWRCLFKKEESVTSECVISSEIRTSQMYLWCGCRWVDAAPASCLSFAWSKVYRSESQEIEGYIQRENKTELTLIPVLVHHQEWLVDVHGSSWWSTALCCRDSWSFIIFVDDAVDRGSRCMILKSPSMSVYARNGKETSL